MHYKILVEKKCNISNALIAMLTACIKFIFLIPIEELVNLGFKK